MTTPDTHFEAKRLKERRSSQEHSLLPPSCGLQHKSASKNARRWGYLAAVLIAISAGTCTTAIAQTSFQTNLGTRSPKSRA